jgi:hypothetical protein
VKISPHLLFVFSATASAQLATDVSAHLKQTSACMLRVLKLVPGVTEPRLGEITSNGLTLPFLEYRAAEKSSWVEPTRFSIQVSEDGSMWYMAMLPGIGPGPIDMHVTSMVLQKWNEECHVTAAVQIG